MGIYEANDRYGPAKSFERALKNGTITLEDRTIIERYINEHTVRRGLTDIRIKKITSVLVNWQVFFSVPISELTTDAIYQGISEFKKKRQKNGKVYAQNYQHDFISIGKTFWAWLADNEIGEIDKGKIREVRVPQTNRDTTEPDEILTEDEIKKLIEFAGDARDRAIISVLYESGMRISEFASMRWRDVVFDQHGVKIYIQDHKKKQRRYCRIILGAPHLIEWKTQYLKYGEPTGNNLVFISKYGKELQYIGYYRLIERTAKNAGVTKKITPHLFRKSRITHMVKNNYQESVIKSMMWGNLNTDMFDVYVKLREEDIDAEMLDHLGIVKKVDTVNPLMPVPCPRCSHLNPPGTAFCGACGISIDDETVEAALSIDPEDILSAMTYRNKMK